MSDVRVSVLMPVFNAARYLREAVDAILAQTLTDFELVCVDDGSTDGSAAILASYGDPRLRVIRQENTGIVGALNRALAESRGELIARMDGDDTCPPHRLERQVAYLDAHAECVAVGTWLTRMDPYGSPAGTQEPPVDHEAIDAALLRGDGAAMVHATLVMRRDALLAAGAWDARYNWVEDLDLFLRLAERGRVANLPEYLYGYRKHVGSVCFRHYRTMCVRLRQVLREAYRRRGLATPNRFEDFRAELEPTQSAATLYRNWACYAIHHGRPGIARRHAVSALVREPWKRESWRVLRWSLAA